MEWVEITAKTIEAAKELALDRLGVAADDAEFEVIEEPRTGLFGRTRGEARVRARVRPTAVRPKRDRRERAKTRRDRGDGEAVDGRADADAVASDAAAVAVDERTDRADERREPRPRGERKRGTGSNKSPRGGSEQKENNVEHQSEVNPEEVGAAAAAFMTGLAEAFGTPATAEVASVGTDIEVRLDGADLGLLIGPGGRTLTAVQDLARVVAQRRLGDHDTRLKIDIAGYREKRREALEKFARAVAAEVIASGRAKALEPMSSADRKVVHDAINDIDGVVSRSDGEEPARRVVIAPG
jgi:spoIIIJ-associated protein